MLKTNITNIVFFSVPNDNKFKIFVSGCITDVYLNDRAVDLHKTDKKNINIGCHSTVDLCRGIKCNFGTCVRNTTLTDGYKCQCRNGYEGMFCEKSSFLFL